MTEALKWQIIGMHRCSKSHREIAATLTVSKTCVTNTIKKFQEEGEVVDKQRSGRPRVTSLREDRIIARVAKKNRKAALPVIMREFEDSTNKKVSKMTISRSLGEIGLKSYVPLKKNPC